jgi:hypothetical protein
MSKLTEERLRTWAIDQASRERMCLAILALNRKFSDVKPRRPKGGPDGGRDIEARFNDNEIFGAVGFRTSVTDSNEDKRWVKSKFLSDLKSALEANSNLHGIVFFTNVDLTPAEEDDLINSAKQKGLSIVEIYHRERIRIVLDSAEGLGLRFQYLDIEMSKPEQAAFFDRWEKDLESLIIKNFGDIDRKLAKIEFLSQLMSDLQHLSFIIHLKEAYSAEELGEYKFVAQIYDSLSQNEPWDTLYIAGYDSNIKQSDGESEVNMIGIQQLAWYNKEPQLKFNTTIGATYTTEILNSIIHIKGKSLPFLKMQELNGKSIRFYISENLVDKIKGVFLVANNYIIVGANEEDLRFAKQTIPFEETLPTEFKDVKEHLQLVKVLKRKLGHKVFEETGADFELNLNGIIPQRIDDRALNFV